MLDFCSETTGARWWPNGSLSDRWYRTPSVFVLALLKSNRKSSKPRFWQSKSWDGERSSRKTIGSTTNHSADSVEGRSDLRPSVRLLRYDRTSSILTWHWCWAFLFRDARPNSRLCLFREDFRRWSVSVVLHWQSAFVSKEHLVDSFASPWEVVEWFSISVN